MSFLFLSIYVTLHCDFNIFLFLFMLHYITILMSFLFLSIYATLRYDFNVFLFLSIYIMLRYNFNVFFVSIYLRYVTLRF